MRSPLTIAGSRQLQVFGAIKGLPRQVAASEGIKKLEEVRLTEDMNNYAGSYSGGMKRRLSCAIALLGNPKVLIHSPDLVIW
jgi:ABC-type multidrug transport system ATPase subunit